MQRLGTKGLRKFGRGTPFLRASHHEIALAVRLSRVAGGRTLRRILLITSYT
jgi:hypothetical protein